MKIRVKSRKGLANHRPRVYEDFPMRIFILVLLVLISGCHRLPHFERPSEANRSSDSEAECQEVTRALPTLNSFRVLANTTVIHDGSATSFRYVVIAKEADKFRIDLLLEGGSYTIGMLVVDGSDATLLDSQQKTFTRSSNEQQLVKSFLGLDGITRPAVLGLLSGYLPRLPCEGIQLYHQDDTIVFEDSLRSLVWYFDRREQQVVRLLGLNEEQNRVVFDGKRVATDVTGKVIVALEVYSPAHVSVALELERVGVNVAVADDLFEVHIPSNFRDVSE